jgi:hypothetical protein
MSKLIRKLLIFFSKVICVPVSRSNNNKNRTKDDITVENKNDLEEYGK